MAVAHDHMERGNTGTNLHNGFIYDGEHFVIDITARRMNVAKYTEYCSMARALCSFLDEPGFL